jgi:ElaA protein
MTIDIIQIPGSDTDALAPCFTIRRQVFCQEQGVPEAIEWDNLDNSCAHYLLTVDGTPVATARVRRYKPGEMKIERVAALKSHRGRGLGLTLMERIMADLRADPTAHEAILNAQTAVRDFYAQLGFAPHGPEFVEADIPHIHMRLKLR